MNTKYTFQIGDFIPELFWETKEKATKRAIETLKSNPDCILWVNDPTIKILECQLVEIKPEEDPNIIYNRQKSEQCY